TAFCIAQVWTAPWVSCHIASASCCIFPLCLRRQTELWHWRHAVVSICLVFMFRSPVREIFSGEPVYTHYRVLIKRWVRKIIFHQRVTHVVSEVAYPYRCVRIEACHHEVFSKNIDRVIHHYFDELAILVVGDLGLVHIEA